MNSKTMIMQIHLTAIVKSKPQHTERLKTILATMVQETRKEKACLQYDLHQELKDPNVFVFYEIWENEAGLAEHNKQSYITAFSSAVDELLEEPPAIYLTKLI